MSALVVEILAAEAVPAPVIRVRTAVVVEAETVLATVVFPAVVAALVVPALLAAGRVAARVAAVLGVHRVWAVLVVVVGVAGN